MNLIKKAFLISMVAVIGLWGVVITPVHADNVASAGDLIKTAGYTAVYYLDASGFKHPFPSEREYFSWYEDFSGVVTVAQSEMTSYTLGASVTVRPGAKLLQYVEISADGTQFLTANTPEVYGVAVDGLLHKIDSAATAVAMYGENWESMITAVPTYLAGGYSATGAMLTSGSMYPSGTLVQLGDQVYYIDGSTKRPVTEAGMTGNRFNADYVITVTDLSAYSEGTSVTAMESGLASPGTGATPPGPVTGTGLTLAVASDSPGAQVGPLQASSVTLMKVNVTASADGAVTLGGLAFKRNGVGATGDFAALYVYDGATRLTSGKTLNGTSHKVTFTNLNVNVPAGTTKTLSLVADISTGTSGNVSYFTVASDGVTTTANINGSFPLMSNTIIIGSSTSGTITINENGTLNNPTVGQQNAALAQFKLTAGSGEDVSLRRVTLYQSGSLNNSYITNLKLYEGSTLLATVPSITSTSLIVFDLSASPYLLSKNTNRTFKVYGDISGSARNGDTTKIYLENDADLYAVGNNFGYGASVDSNDADGYDGTDTSCTSEATCGDSTYLSVVGGQITVSKNGPSSSSLAQGANGAVFLNFSITAGVNAEIRKLRVELHNDDVGSDLDKDDSPCSLDYITNVKIVDVDNGESTSSVDCSSFSDIDTAADDGVYYDFTDYFTFTAGQTRNFQITADLHASLTANDYYVSLGSTGTTYTTAESSYAISGTSGIKNTDNNQWITDVVPTSVIDGNEMTVASASLTMNLASNQTGVTVVQGTEDVNLGEFTYAAGDGSDMTVSSLTITGYVASTSPTGAGSVASGTACTAATAGAPWCINMGADAFAYVNAMVSNLQLFDVTADPGMTTPINPTTEGLSSSAGTATFNNLTWIIPAGETHVLRVVGDTSNTTYAQAVAGNKHVKVRITAESISDESGTSVDLTETTNNGAATTMGSSYYITITNAGTLNITAEGNPSIANVVAGTSDVPMLNLKMQATNEAFNLNKIRIQQSQNSTSNRSLDSVTISYLNQAGATVTANVAELSGNADFNITNNPMYIPSGTSRIMNVFFNIPAINSTNATYTGDELYANFDSDANFEAKSAGSGNTNLTAPSDTTDRPGNVMTVFGTFPRFTIDNTTNVNLFNGPAELYRFQVSTPPEGGTSLSLKKLSFRLSMTDSVANTNTLSLTNFQVYEGTSYTSASALTQGDTGTDSYQVYNGWGATGTTADGEGTGGKLSATTGKIYQNYAGNSSSTYHDIIVVFNDDRLISAGSIKYYIVKATAGNVSSSDSVSMYLRNGDTTTTSYSYITGHCDVLDTPSGLASKVCLTDDTSSTNDAAAFMIWSDNTGTNGNNTHTDVTSGDASSGDWFNGYSINTLDVARILYQ